MDNEYSTRSNFLESVAVVKLMRMGLGKMVVIRLENAQRERKEKVKAGYMKRIKSNRL